MDYERQIGQTKRGGEVSEETATKTYMTTEQFIKAWKSLDDDKRKELSAAWDTVRDTTWYAAWNNALGTAWYAVQDTACAAAWNTAWYAVQDTAWYAVQDTAWYAVQDTAWNNAWYTARDADLAVLVRDKITVEQFEILTQPWTSCHLSLFAEDWQRLQQSEVEK